MSKGENYCMVCHRDLSQEIAEKGLPDYEVRFFHKVVHSINLVDKLATDPPVSQTKAIAATLACRIVSQPFSERMDTREMLEKISKAQGHVVLQGSLN